MTKHQSGKQKNLESFTFPYIDVSVLREEIIQINLPTGFKSNFVISAFILAVTSLMY